jgi:hypothetical protein
MTASAAFMTTFTITADHPVKISSFVPTYLLLANQGTAAALIGDRGVSATSYAFAIEPQSATPALYPSHVKEIAVSSVADGDDVYAIAATGSIELDVVQYGGGGYFRRDALRSIVSGNWRGVPLELLSGDTLEDVIDSAARAERWIVNILTGDSATEDDA